MAGLEGLESAPRDLVNRAFRELPVELQSLERIGRALGVEAWTLYRTADEDEIPAATPLDGKNRSRLALFAAVAAGMTALFAVIGGAWWLTVRGFDTAGIDSHGVSAPLPLTLGIPTLVVLPIDGDDGALATALRGAFGDQFSVADPRALIVTEGMAPAEASETLRTDIAIDGAIVTVGRWSGIRLHALSGGVRRPFWVESLPSVALPSAVEEIADRAVRALRRATGRGGPVELPAPHFPLPPVQDDYLEGRLHLDRPANELNIRRAQSRFEAALRQDANYARAHAGLCEALLEEYWMADEERALKDAARTCGQALQLDPEDPVVKVTHAHFLARTGRNEEAIALYKAVIARHPRDSDALAGLADSRLQAWRQNGDPDELAAAMASARAAADADPAVWKPLFALATMHWFAGDLQGAITASEEAIRRDSNEYVLANLGTWYVCAGEFTKARDVYLAARDLAPQSYVGDEFLGMVNYFMGDFARSAELRRSAIEAIATGEPEIHEMWGNLADSYRQAGEKQAAVDAYLHAAAILERDHLRGSAPEADRAKRAYYYLRLASLAPDRVSPQTLTELRAELDEIAVAQSEAAAHRRMAEIWLLTGEEGKARQELALAIATCPGYAELPDLAALK